MSTPRPRAAGIVALLVICCPAVLPQDATADWFGEYYPLNMNASWTYQNDDPPFDQYTESVFEQVIYEGHDAVRKGQDLTEHIIISSDGLTLTGYAEVHDGVLYDYTEDTVFGEFSDGSTFVICPGGECDTLLVRDWDALDPTLRSIYEIDPTLEDLVVVSSYNVDHDANLHNAILTSNLPGGITPPGGAVTNIDWFQRGIGLVATQGIDAPTGGIERYYYLVDYALGVGDQPGAPDAIMLARNYPNPFNPSTTIEYVLTHDAAVTITVHDAAGRLLRTLEPGAWRSAGSHTATWTGENDRGRSVASGTYFCRLHAAGSMESVSMLLVR